MVFLFFSFFLFFLSFFLSFFLCFFLSFFLSYFLSFFLSLSLGEGDYFSSFSHLFSCFFFFSFFFLSFSFSFSSVSPSPPSLSHLPFHQQLGVVIISSVMPLPFPTHLFSHSPLNRNPFFALLVPSLENIPFLPIQFPFFTSVLSLFLEYQPLSVFSPSFYLPSFPVCTWFVYFFTFSFFFSFSFAFSFSFSFYFLSLFSFPYFYSFFLSLLNQNLVVLFSNHCKIC